ncbi:related to TOS1 Target of SBF [Ramularia collo-cygni]|uniref:glucan endo-1,3-beta-D-glucosidase n=1 Tax=Ramularia collo-cygni TaxID=112498 RepID=A0A2D3UT55_9PEZI|nr:related to TOS1 Target of SBF [Ramularia collo-cygni]CZT19551.1 related to TOS1 Target of SBF [Ramularia collo-cygni]
MKSFIAATLFAATALADLCAHGSTDDNGNYYCQKVNAITYSGVGGTGSYNKITAMDSTGGTCASSPSGYSGTMSPFDEEVSMHFRGPLNLKQFAVYTPSSSPSKAKLARRSANDRRHAHGHGHAHLHHARDAAAKEKRGLGDMVTAMINGEVVSWVNEYAGGAAATSAAAPAASTAEASAPAAYQPARRPAAASSDASASSHSSASSSDDDSSSSNGWTRQAYYDASSGTSNGLVFLNHEGGTGSGVFDMQFGNSLSYASTDACSGVAAPTVLEDCTLKSSTEVVIMSDKKCSDDEGCGFSRDGTVAYHGFDGPSKAFFFEFGMPDSGETATNPYDPVNMPAIWMLNAQIPRTLQYGKPECSCWTTGCGEFDIFEVLAAGDTRCKSTMHGNIAGGDSDYFERPVTGTIKAALLLYKDNMHIKIIDNSTEFGNDMPMTFLDDMVKDTMEDSLSNLVSLFKLSS